jgi:hypothetical protein
MSAAEILAILAILAVLTIRPISATAMPPPPAVAESILATVALIVAVRSGILLRLAAAGDECRKTADILSAVMATLVGLRIRLLLLLMLLMMLRPIVHLLIPRRKWLRITRQIRLLLWFARRVTRLVLTHEGLTILVVAIEGIVAAGLLRLAARHAALLMRLLLIVVRVLLTKLLLCRGDQAEVVLGVLIIILGGHRIARPLRVTRELNVFFRDM